MATSRACSCDTAPVSQAATPWRAAQDSVSVAVKVQPKSRRPGLQGQAPDIDGPRLRIGVTEAAEDGRANKAACAVLAQAMGIAASSVSVIQGASSRQKLLRIAGDPVALTSKLASLLNDLPGNPA
jgi:uncharacterized protein YggU (UPF0235/DUF167 family)